RLRVTYPDHAGGREWAWNVQDSLGQLRAIGSTTLIGSDGGWAPAPHSVKRFEFAPGFSAPGGKVDRIRPFGISAPPDSSVTVLCLKGGAPPGRVVRLGRPTRVGSRPVGTDRRIAPVASVTLQATVVRPGYTSRTQQYLLTAEDTRAINTCT